MTKDARYFVENFLFRSPPTRVVIADGERSERAAGQLCVLFTRVGDRSHVIYLRNANESSAQCAL
jgi:hypothetical protein